MPHEIDRVASILPPGNDRREAAVMPPADGCRGKPLLSAMANSRAEIIELQYSLLDLGFYSGKTDGIFGPLTRQAVEKLQRYCGLEPDGCPGPLTRQAVNLLLPHVARQGNRLSGHFQEWEFHCRCGCNIVRINPGLVAMLEKLRSVLGNKPITILSGYRCREHNAAVGGVKHSQHLSGNAADIVVVGIRPVGVADAAETLNFPGLGRYRDFTHVDVRANGPARWTI